MKFLVTGGAGFIGSNLVDKLIDLGHSVIVIDNKLTESDNPIFWNDSADNYEIDVSDYDLIEPLFDGVDYVFHLASVSRVQQSIDDPLLAIKTNVLGTASVLEACRKHNVKRMVYSSTSSAYGYNAVPNIETQDSDCLNPYSTSKVAGEMICSMYHKLFNVETIILRYFNVYGNRQPLGGKYTPLIGLFQTQKELGVPLSVTGNGEQRRDFINVIDVVDANIKAAMIDIPKDIIGTVFNVGSSQNYSVNEVAKMFNHDVVFIGSKPGEAIENLASIDKAVKYLNWTPSISLEQWIKDNV